MAISADAVTVELVAKTDGYNQKINAAAANTDAAMKKTEASVNRAENVINLSAARIANGQRNLGRQFADVGASLSSGSSPFVVLAQQLPQIADALTDTGGKAARFAAVLTGPVGAAGLAVASILATTLLPKLLETGEGVDDLVSKLQDNARKAELASQADRIFAGTQAGLRAAIAETTRALDEQNASLRTNAQLRNINARRQAALAEAQQAQAQADVESARNRVRQTFSQGGTRGEVASARAIQQAEQADAALKSALENSRQAQINVNRSRVFLAAENASANATAQGRINKLYDERVRAVERAAYAEANAGKQVGAATQQRIAAIEAERQAALKAESDRDRASRPRRARAAARGRALSSTKIPEFDYAGLNQATSDGAIFARITDDATEAARRAARQFRAIFGEESKDFPDPFANVAASDAARKVAFDQRAEDLEKLHRQEEQNIRSLADIYQSAFEGGVGGIWKQFKQEGIRAIALVLAQLTLGKSLGQALGSLGNTSGGAGNLGGIGSTIASLFAKRASGGDVSAGKIYHINEGGSRKELFQPAQSGKIYPTGALQAKQAGGGQSVFLTQTFTLDARGGITTPQLLQYVNQTARTEATRAGQTAYQASPARSARLQTLGT